MIHDVKTKKLKVIPDDRGRLMEMLRADDELFERFGQVYLSTTYPGVVKAWHYHKLQKDNFVCVKGMVKLVLADTREGSPTKGQIDEFVIGEHNPVLVQVPIGVYHGWKCIGTGEAFVINTATMPYDYREPDEYRLDPHRNDQIEYDWTTKDR
jgi:dTDP-4-dehydrorhamnose 3,5-epimerase